MVRSRSAARPLPMREKTPRPPYLLTPGGPGILGPSDTNLDPLATKRYRTLRMRTSRLSIPPSLPKVRNGPCTTEVSCCTRFMNHRSPEARSEHRLGYPHICRPRVSRLLIRNQTGGTDLARASTRPLRLWPTIRTRSILKGLHTIHISPPNGQAYPIVFRVQK